jgi:hypothetical protein
MAQQNDGSRRKEYTDLAPSIYRQRLVVNHPEFRAHSVMCEPRSGRWFARLLYLRLYPCFRTPPMAVH